MDEISPRRCRECKVSAQQLEPTVVSQSSPVVFMLSRQRTTLEHPVWQSAWLKKKKNGKKRRQEQGAEWFRFRSLSGLKSHRG